MRRLLLLAALLAAAPVAQATVLLPAEFSEIVNGSEIIVHGQVVDVRADWSGDRLRIDTLVTVQAGSYMKGGPGETVTFRVPGGTVGRYSSVLVSAPQFRVGEEVVLFLDSSGPAIAHVFGLNQGVFRIRREARSGRRFVVPPAVVARSAPAQAVRRGALDRRPVLLDTFRQQVRSAMTAGVR